MVGQSRNLKDSDPDGGDQALPEGEQIQPDPPAILHSIPPLPMPFISLSDILILMAPSPLRVDRDHRDDW